MINNHNHQSGAYLDDDVCDGVLDDENEDAVGHDDEDHDDDGDDEDHDDDDDDDGDDDAGHVEEAVRIFPAEEARVEDQVVDAEVGQEDEFLF